MMKNFDLFVKMTIKIIHKKGIRLSDFDKSTIKDKRLSYYAPHKLTLSNDDLYNILWWYKPFINAIPKKKQKCAMIEIILFIDELKKTNKMLDRHSEINEVTKELKARERLKHKDKVLEAIDTILNSMYGQKFTLAQRTLTVLLKLFKRQLNRLYYIPKNDKDDKGITSDMIFNIKSHRKYFDKRQKKYLVGFLHNIETKYNIKIRQYDFNQAITNTSI